MWPGIEGEGVDCRVRRDRTTAGERMVARDLGPAKVFENLGTARVYELALIPYYVRKYFVFLYI